MRIALGLLCLIVLGLSSCRTVPEAPENIPPTAEGYKQVFEDKILGPIWYRLVKQNESLANVGTVKLTFEIPAAGGRVRNLKIISNTGGKTDERIAREAVERLRAPTIPGAILQRTHDDHIVFEESFTIYQNPVSPAPSPKKR